MIFDSLKQWDRYDLGPAWRTAFEAIEQLGPDSPEGDFQVRGEDIYLRVLSYPTKERPDAVIESHREYVDIQSTLKGAERLDWFERDLLTPRTEYDPVKDVVFYDQPEKMVLQCDFHPRTFVALFPRDAHRPGLIVPNAPREVKKVVVKIRAKLLGQS